MGSEPVVDKSRLIKNTIYNSFAQAFSLISVLVFTPMLLKSFDRLQFGLYTLAVSIVASLALLDFGVGQSLTVQIAKDDTSNSLAKIRDKTRAALQLYAGIGILVACILCVLGYFSDSLFKVDAAGGVSLSTLLYVSAVIQFFYWPLQTSRHILAGLKEFKVISTSTLITVLLTIIAMAITVGIGRGPVVLTVLVGLALLVGQTHNGYKLAKILSLRDHQEQSERVSSGSGVLEGKSSREHIFIIIKGLILAGLPLFVIQISGTLMREQTDRIVLGVLLGGVAVATYEIGAKFSLMFSQAIALGVSAVLPVVSNLEAAQDQARIRQLYLRGSRYLSLLLFPLAAALIMLADTILLVWLGSLEPQAALVMRLLVAAQFFTPLYILGDSILIAQKRYTFWISAALILAVANLGLSIALVHYFGVAGAAAGTLIANLLEFPVFSYYLLRITELPVKEWMKTSFLPSLALLVPSLLVSLLCKYVLAGAPFFQMLVSGVTLVVSYWLTAYVFLLQDWEKSQLRGFLEKSLKK